MIIAPRYFIDPFGCVKNQVDAENMMALLNNAGWENAANAEDADLIIVNSCGFIESAKKESINAVLEWRKFFPNKKILLTGCLSQRYAKDLPEILKEADGFMGVDDISQIVHKAGEIISAEDTEKSKGVSIYTGERPLLSLPGSAYVKISEGCSNNCSYCAIPLIRGSLVCRSIPDIIDECRTLLARGIKELCIIGQDIGGYDPTGNTEEKTKKLPELLQAIAALDGDFWVRLLYIHPDHFPLQILDLIERDSRFLPYFDIPFQHASQKILSAMNRKGTAEKYLELIKTIRTRLPNAVIRSTFLLGFPGETEEEFSALLDFQQKAKIDWLGCFEYSREEGTTAYNMKNNVSAKTAAKRRQIIEESQIAITEKNMDRFVLQTDFAGQTLEVLIEELIEPAAGSNDEPIWLGRLYCQAPDIDGAAVIIGSGKKEKVNLQLGTLLPCKVTSRRGFDLEVQII
ncbi:MAG: 30S ribosomal protein S12 methylthiotransferase RimO [Treponema sp.]|nr:30S ribosomal protein S12 methylthiotransferase RimO [Treponema sp.]